MTRLNLEVITLPVGPRHHLLNYKGVVHPSPEAHPASVRDWAHYAVAMTETPAAGSDDTQVSAPFQGLVTLLVEPGAHVSAGDVVAVLEAMKMEAPITAPRAGVVTRTAFTGSQAVVGGDVLLVLT